MPSTPRARSGSPWERSSWGRSTSWTRSSSGRCAESVLSRVLQGIASGLLGRSSFSGGAWTAALGLILHFFIATAVVLVYFAAARRLPALRRSPLLWGPLYGIAVFLVMYLVVMPLSAIGPRPITLPVAVNGILIHILGVGIPAALTARSALRPAA